MNWMISLAATMALTPRCGALEWASRPVTEVAKTWQAKPRSYEDPSVQPAAAEEPVGELPARGARTAARDTAIARADDAGSGEAAAALPPTSTARSAATTNQRPVWSPFRP